jgi:hypothetical protein
MNSRIQRRCRSLVTRLALGMLSALTAPATLALAAPNTHAAAQSVTYETVYSGFYSFSSDGSSSAYGTTDKRQSFATYGFNTVTDDEIEKKGPRITEYTSSRVSSSGTYHFQDVSNNTTPTYQDCTFGGKGKQTSKPYTSLAPPQKTNPLLTYAWELPDATGNGLSWTCGSGIFLPVTPTDAYLSGTPTLNINDQAFDEAFNGSGSTHYNDLPVSRPVDATIKATDPIVDPAGDTIGSISSHVTVDAKVRYLLFGSLKKKSSKQTKVTKMTKLLLQSALETLGISAGGPSPIANGDPSDVLVPGPAPGQVSLSVTGAIISDNDIETQSRLPRAATATLFSGSGRITSALGTVIALRPSTAAHAALSTPHPSIPITMRATFTPDGARTPVSATLTGTIAATTSASP